MAAWHERFSAQRLGGIVRGEGAPHRPCCDAHASRLTTAGGRDPSAGYVAALVTALRFRGTTGTVILCRYFLADEAGLEQVMRP